MSTILTLAPKTTDIKDALDVIDKLRADVESGKLKFFTCVGIDSEHVTYAYQASTRKTTLLEAIGAVTSLLHNAHLHDGMEDE